MEKSPEGITEKYAIMLHLYRARFDAMNYAALKEYFHHHCKIKLRSGKEVFGVVWEDLNETDRAIYFASYIEHKRLMSRELGGTNPAESLIQRLKSDDILGIEPVLPEPV